MQLVFLVFTGEAWGYLGSRRFLLELDQQSDAVRGLNSSLIQLVFFSFGWTCFALCHWRGLLWLLFSYFDQLRLPVCTCMLWSNRSFFFASSVLCSCPVILSNFLFHRYKYQFFLWLLGKGHGNWVNWKGLQSREQNLLCSHTGSEWLVYFININNVLEVYSNTKKFL